MDQAIEAVDDPVLYRVTARIGREGSDSIDETSTRRRFREFRFEDRLAQMGSR